MNAPRLLSATDRPKVLYLTHRMPFPPDKGDRIRSSNVLRDLAEWCDVWLGCLADEPWSTAAEAELATQCAEYRIAPLDHSRWLQGAAGLLTGAPLTTGLFSSTSLRQWIRQAATRVRFDVVMAFCSTMAPYAWLPELRGVPTIVDLVDVDSEKWRQLAEVSRWPRRLVYRREARRLRALENRIGADSAAVVVVSEAEAEIYRQVAPHARVVVAGNGVDADYFRSAHPTPENSQSVVFVGALDYRPNVDGIVWFCRNLWPHVVKQWPAAELQIVGRRPVRAVHALADLPNVSLHADVPDVRPYLQRARLAVAPLMLARGVQNKVLEALAMARPVVASPAALQGLSVSRQEGVIAANDPSEWIGSILSLLNDSNTCSQLGALGRLCIEERFNWSEQLRPVRQLIESLVAYPERPAARRTALV